MRRSQFDSPRSGSSGRAPPKSVGVVRVVRPPVLDQACPAHRQTRPDSDGHLPTVRLPGNGADSRLSGLTEFQGLSRWIGAELAGERIDQTGLAPDTKTLRVSDMITSNTSCEPTRWIRTGDRYESRFDVFNGGSQEGSNLGSSNSRTREVLGTSSNG